MNNLESLSQILTKGIGRSEIDIVIQAVEHNPILFSDLVLLFLSNQEPVSRQAAWVVDVLTERHPDWIRPWIEEMTAKLPEFRHDGLKRHTLRMLCTLPLPVENLGLLIQQCFNYLVTHEAIAVKVYAMEILYRVSLQEPDIKTELADTISWRLSEESPGVRNRAFKILKKLSR